MITFLWLTFRFLRKSETRKHIFITAKFGLENVSFTHNELISLYFIKEILNSYSALEIGINASFLVDRIISHLPQINRDYIKSLNELVKVNPIEVIREESINPEFLKKIRDAISFRKRFRISYYAFNTEETTERCVDPYLVEIHEGCYHLVGFCHLRNKIREFRVSRMKELEVLDESF